MNNNNNSAETAAIAALSVASKTPFMTAFKVTIGIGLARFLMFIGIVSVITMAISILK